MTCPDDFSLEYTWQSGSVPPPHYYEYTVAIHSDGRGWVRLLQDYPQHNPEPRLAEFFVSQEDIKQLCETMRSSGIFDHLWKAGENDEMVGGESASLTVEIDQQVIRVPPVLSMVDGLRFTPVYEMIRALAAQAVERLRGESEM